MTTTEDTIQRAFDRYAAARWGYPGEIHDVVTCIDSLHAIAREQQGEIRMLKMCVAELADEEPATVAAEADDLHPVARLLAEAYRLAIDDDEVSSVIRRDIRLAWSQIVDSSKWHGLQIIEYGR